MNNSPQLAELTREKVNPKAEMTGDEMTPIGRRHFEKVRQSQKNLDLADLNFAPEFVDHGLDVPPSLPPRTAGAKAYVASAIAKFPSLRVTLDDPMAEADRVVVRNTRRATSPQSVGTCNFDES